MRTVRLQPDDCWPGFSNSRRSLKFILGVTPSPVGLVIDPRIPKSWTGYKVTRKFRGKLYSIDVKNPHRLSKGVTQMLVDGRVVQGNVISLSPGSKLVHVVVELGG